MAGLIGLSQLIRNLNVITNQISDKNLKGLIKATILIRRDMENTSPLIPVDTGNLRASWFVVTSKGSTSKGKSSKFKGDKAGELTSQHKIEITKGKAELNKRDLIAVKMGFSANYAFFVHEMIGVSNIKIGKKKQISPLSKRQRQAFGVARFSRPGSGPKFFEAALRRNSGKIIKILLDEAKIV